MKIPKRKEGETLFMWRKRIEEAFHLSEQMKEILRDVSVASYIHGVNDGIDAAKKQVN